MKTRYVRDERGTLPTRGTRLLAVSTLALVLAGCGTVQLQPATQEEIRNQTTLDLLAAREGVEPITGTLSMDEAVARALKYNLDRRTKLMEEALAFNNLEAGNWDMLPRVMANAGYSQRNKDLITDIQTIGGGVTPGNTISSERGHAMFDLGLTWNMLDYGLSYLGAKQQADRVLIAAERRRKAMHTLIQDVRTAFWRTASAQKLREDVRKAILLAEEALEDSRKAEAERLRSPVDALRYQRQLLENLRLLESIEQELASGRIELANLINAPLHQDFRVEEPSDKVDASLLDVPVTRMEELALAQNADIREHFYGSRIAAQEIKRTMLRLFPNLSFNTTLRYDTDRFLINNQWNDVGLQLSYNLINLFSANSQKRLAEAGVQLADQRRIASQMAVMTQVHLARLQYQIAYRQYLRADAIWQADAKISEHIRNREAAETQSKLEQVANSTTAILSLLRRYQSLSQVQGAGSRLQATMGLEPLIASTSELSLQELTKAVGESLRDWSRGIPASSAKEGAPVVCAEQGGRCGCVSQRGLVVDVSNTVCKDLATHGYEAVYGKDKPATPAQPAQPARQGARSPEKVALAHDVSALPLKPAEALASAGAPAPRSEGATIEAVAIAMELE